MIVARHPDGRVILMAQEHGLKPMLRGADGTWTAANISGGELQDFLKVRSESERKKILHEGLQKASRTLIIGGARKKTQDNKPAAARVVSSNTERKQSPIRTKAEAYGDFKKPVARVQKKVASGKNVFTGEPISAKPTYSRKMMTKRPSKVSA